MSLFLVIFYIKFKIIFQLLYYFQIDNAELFKTAKLLLDQQVLQAIYKVCINYAEKT